MGRKWVDRLTTAAAWVAVGFGVAALAAWPASYWRGTVVAVLWVYSGRTDMGVAEVQVGAGGLGVYVGAISDSTGSLGPFPAGWQYEVRRLADPPYPRPAVSGASAPFGFSAGVARLPWAIPSAGLSHEAGLVAPLWAWALAAGLLPAWGLRRRHRRRRRDPGQAFEVVRPV